MRNSMNTYGMITGMSSSGIALGSAIGPIVGGEIIDVLDFTWCATIIGLLAFAMVSCVYLVTIRTVISDQSFNHEI